MRKWWLAVLVLSLASFHAVYAENETNRDPASSQKRTYQSTTTTTSKSTTSTSSDEDEPYGKREGLLGPVKIGPQLTLLGALVPFRFGIDVKYESLLGAGIDYGFIPTIGVSSTANVGFGAFKFNARVFPFRRALFIGLGLGSQWLTASEQVTVTGTPVTLTVNINSLIFVPHVGWKWEWESGFFMGMEFGVQFGLSSTAVLSGDSALPATITSDPKYAATKADVENVGQGIGQVTLPFVSLLQIGYLF